MPVYAYACTACGHAFDAKQSFTEPALTVCGECGGALRKQYGTVGVTFNGSGFYRTDSRAAAKGGASKGGASKAGSSQGGASKDAGSGSSAPKTSSSPQPAGSTSTASSGGAGAVS